MWLFAIVSLVSLFLIILLLSSYRQRRFFESKGIPYNGNGLVRLLLVTARGQNFADDILAQYKKMKGKGYKVTGGTDFGKSTLLIADTDLLKSILVKDFDHFTDHRNVATGKGDYLISRMLFVMTGEPWKLLRSKLSPTFTTGKIKRLFRLFDASGQKFVKFLESELQRSEKIELSEAYSKFTMDIIASAACGIDSQAFNQKEPSVFEQNGKKMQLQLNVKMLFKLMAMVLLPQKISDFFGLSFFGNDVQSFFVNIIKSTIKRREETGEQGNDFVQLMLEARAGTLKTEEAELDSFEKDAMITAPKIPKVSASDVLDDDGIVANCVLFILAGFDTTQSLLLFLVYALAMNPEVQDTLRAHVKASFDENDGQFTYEGLSQITYLDMVINETLRLWPPAPATDRQCIMDYTIPGTNFVLKKGDVIAVPIFGLHHDSEFFPNPEKFDPERFSPENKSKVNQYAFLPFGQGPRNCIGMRFALMEAKVVVSYLVNTFRIEPTAKTPVNIKFAKSSSLKPDGHLHLRLTKINY